MTSYTLHLPPGAQPGHPSGLDGAKLVKDGFSWGAFLFTFLWFFAHRLWLAGIAVLVGLACVSAALGLLGVHGALAGAVIVLAMILVGLEAGTLRRWTYGRRGSPALDVVTAETLDEAEAKAFARWLQRSDAIRPAPPTANAPSAPAYAGAGRRPDVVIGMFPDAERSR